MCKTLADRIKDHRWQNEYWEQMYKKKDHFETNKAMVRILRNKLLSLLAR